MPARFVSTAGLSCSSTSPAPAPGRTDRGAIDFTPPPGWTDLVDELDPQPTDHLITKHRRGAFADTDLDERVRRDEVTQIVLCGLSTSAGVESTARAAHDLGYHVVLATDAMSDHDLETHEHSTQRIFPGLGETASTDLRPVLARRAARRAVRG